MKFLFNTIFVRVSVASIDSTILEQCTCSFDVSGMHPVHRLLLIGQIACHSFPCK